MVENQHYKGMQRQFTDASYIGINRLEFILNDKSNPIFINRSIPPDGHHPEMNDDN